MNIVFGFCSKDRIIGFISDLLEAFQGFVDGKKKRKLGIGEKL